MLAQSLRGELADVPGLDLAGRSPRGSSSRRRPPVPARPCWSACPRLGRANTARLRDLRNGASERDVAAKALAIEGKGGGDG